MLALHADALLSPKHQTRFAPISNLNSMAFACKKKQGQQVTKVPNVCVDVSVEMAVCSLLLGDSEKAEDILGLSPESDSSLADPSIKSYVMVCCLHCLCLL